MMKFAIVLSGLLALFASAVHAQTSLPNRAASAINGAEGLAGPTVTPPPGTSGVDLSANSTAGGDLPGGFGMKVGDKVIKFRGAVGVGDDRSNAKAGVGIPF